jgi:hypothetical protein
MLCRLCFFGDHVPITQGVETATSVCGRIISNKTRSATHVWPKCPAIASSFFSTLCDSFPEEANDCGGIALLREPLANDGYLLLRGLHDEHKVELATHVLLQSLHGKGLVVNSDAHALEEGFYTGKMTSAGSRTHLDLQVLCVTM